MKFVSWNVNGLRAVLGKGFAEIFKDFAADWFCIQETKLQEGQVELDFEGYVAYFDSADKKGYSGTAIIAKTQPTRVSKGIGVERHDHEGRAVTLEYEHFFLVNVYTPNSQAELARLNYRMDWEDEFLHYVLELDKVKPVIICGDMNVAHKEIDLKNPKTNRRNAGFTDEERGCMSRLLESGFVDTFRAKHGDVADAYTWWSYRFKAREKNIGWRIDYFLISKRLLPYLGDASIHPEITGSDHCPVSIILEIPE